MVYIIDVGIGILCVEEEEGKWRGGGEWEGKYIILLLGKDRLYLHVPATCTF